MKQTLSFTVLLAAIMVSYFAVSATAASVVAADTDTAVAVATVVSVDEKTRNVTLVGPEGDNWTFTAGPEVRNFDQIKRGDRIMASYYAGFAIGIGPKGSGIKDRVGSTAMARAKKGEKPGVIIANSIVAIGIVKAIDNDNRTVTLEGPERTIMLAVSEDVDLSKISVGGEVEALFVESYAISVVPAPKVSGTVTLESTSIAIGVGVTWGHGTLTMHDGSTHKIKVGGLSVVDLGISKISATGELFNLVEAKDLEGTFATGEAGITVIGGGSVSAMKNGNGVVLQLKSSQKGLKLTLAPGGMSIDLVE
jgi:Cu/Ag efflux protein CusF